jgi:glycerophosphoryl diester phosphodiesterase
MDDENALPAFAAVEELGYRYVETDIRTSNDGVPFVFHDPDLKRLTGEAKRIEEMSAKEVADVVLPHGAHIPTLTEALRLFPRLRFNIDLKDLASVGPVVRVLTDEDVLQRVCVASFSERRIAAARHLLGPEVCTGLGIGGILRVALTSLLPGRTRTDGASVLQIPFRRHGIRLVNQRVVRWAHRAGLVVHVWTLNDRRMIEQALDMGVDGVMTDEPQLLKEILLARGQWRGS